MKKRSYGPQVVRQRRKGRIREKGKIRVRSCDRERKGKKQSGKGESYGPEKVTQRGKGRRKEATRRKEVGERYGHEEETKDKEKRDRGAKEGGIKKIKVPEERELYKGM